MLSIGVTFYPDQWPREYWRTAFSQMAASGFKLVRFGEMAWNWIEPSDGDFRFTEMQEALDLAHQHGLKVLLGIPTSQAPTWLIKKHPEIRPVADDMTPYPEYGPRPNVCRDSDIFRKYAKRMIEKLVEKFAKHPAVYMWQMDNEPVYPPLDSTTSKDFCHCGHTAKAFREWAKNEYGDIKKLNEKWGTRFWTVEFSSFDDITPPRCGMWDAGDPHIFLDWFRFKSESLLSFLEWGKAIVKKIDPDHKVGTNGFIGICSRVPDHDVLASFAEWYGLDIYPRGNRASEMDVARILDHWRSFTTGRDCEFHVTELQGGQNVRWGYPGHVEGPEIRLWTHQVFAHGAKTMLYHNWRTPLFGSETGGFGILKLRGERSGRLEKIEQAIKEIDRVSYVIDKTKAACRIAIAHLRGSEVETYQEQGPTRGISGQWMEVRSDIGLMHGLLSSSGAHKAAWRHFDPVSFIFERQLDNGNLPYEAVMIPNPYVLKDKAAKCLRKYIYDGGIVITEARFGLKDENGKLYEKPLMESLLEVRYDHTEIIDTELKISSLDARVVGFRDVVEAEDRDVAARFDDGNPALIVKTIGKGRIVYAAFSLFHSILGDDSGKLIELVRKYLPKPEFSLTGPEKVEMVHLVGEKNVLYVINHANVPASVRITMPAKFRGARDALSEAPYSASGGSMNVDLKGEDVKVLVLD